MKPGYHLGWLASFAHREIGRFQGFFARRTVHQLAACLYFRAASIGPNRNKKSIDERWIRNVDVGAVPHRFLHAIGQITKCPKDAFMRDRYARTYAILRVDARTTLQIG